MVTDAKEVERLIDWMIDGAPGMDDGQSIVSHICERLNAAGVHVDLYRLFIFTIHPIIKGRRLQWTADEGTVITNAEFALFETPEYLDNPLKVVQETQIPIRRRLVDRDCPRDYKVIDELIADGLTDYFVQPAVFVDGEVHTMSWSSRHPDGFSPEDIALLERVRGPLTRLAESYVLRLNAANILSTYVGRNAGAKVLSGQVKRGDLEEIEAVILFADLKDYTQLSNELSPEEMIACLNAYFDAIAGPVGENGGEILKFMGDGVLAIFPLRDGGKEAQRATAQKARMAVLDAAKTAATEDRICPFRSALHMGRLFYGNIGAARRLDFTAIGPAVNLAARLLGAAATVGVDHVCSAPFAEMLDEPAREITKVPLKGFAEEVCVLAL